MNANVTPRSRKKNQAPPISAGLPLSGANAEDDARRSVEPNTNSTPAAPLTARPSPESSGLATVGAEPSTALMVVGDVKLAMRSEQTRRDIAQLLQDAGSITSITNADGRQQAHALLMLFVKARIAIDGRYEEVSVSVRSFLDDLRDERGDLKESFAQSETRLRKLRDEWDTKIADEKRLKAEAEQRRKQAIENRIEEIRATREEAIGKKAAEIAEIIATVEGIAIDETFAELKLQADSAKSMTLGKLRYLHTAAVNLETEQKRLQEVRERLDREKAEQDAAAAVERERIAEEQRAAQAENARIKATQDARDAEVAEQQRLYNEEQERIRQRNEMALQEISAIHQQLSIAIVGRAPYIKGGDVESFDQVIAETEVWQITEEKFGALTVSAQRTKDGTVATLKQRRAELIQQIANEVAAQAERERVAEENGKAEEVRQWRERATEAIRTIRDRVHIAAEGDSLEAYDLALSVTQGEVITEERFGVIVGMARTVQNDTLETLRQRRAALAKRLADEAELEEKRQAQEAEAKRLAAERAENERIEAERKASLDAEETRQAEQRAEIDRQQEALRLERETIIAPTDPAEAVTGEPLAIPTHTQMGAMLEASGVLPAYPDETPTNSPALAREIVELSVQAIEDEYSVDEVTARAWLVEAVRMTEGVTA